MLITYLKTIFFLFTLFLFSSLPLHAKFVDINNSNISLLEHSSVYFDEQNLSLEEIISKKKFKPYTQNSINIGAEKKMVWVKLDLENQTETQVKKILLLYSPFLEHIYLYKEDNLSNPIIKGQAHFSTEQQSLLHYFPISISKKSQKIFYIKSYSNYVSLRFLLTLNDEKSYLKKDRHEQIINLFLIGFIFALMLYSFVVSLYTKDKSYLFYSLYLFILLYDQARFIGLSQVYFPHGLMLFDLKISIIRIYALLIASSVFTLYFLNIKKYPKIYKIYLSIMTIALFAIIFLDNTQSLGMSLALILTLSLALFNLFTGIYTYRQGEKQARLYILGFGIVLISYLMIIADIVGILSMTQHYPNVLLWSTAFEALVLSLAFADRYALLEEEKEHINKLFLKEAQNRASLIELEVIKKTKQLGKIIQTKELLLQEVHHRVKNNLHIILSIIQLQNHSSNSLNENNILQDLENRINAIAKTYEQLIVNDDLQSINMTDYIKSLITEIEQSFASEDNNITITLHIKAILSLKEAVYVGLIINELVSNAYKYAFDRGKGKINIELYEKNNTFRLIVKDNGKGFKPNKNKNSLGLLLVNTLVTEQLQGTIKANTLNGSEYIIKF